MSKVRISFADSDLITLVFRDGALSGADLVDYAPQSGDNVWGRLVVRDNSHYGRLTSDGDIWLFDRLTPGTLADFATARPDGSGRVYAAADLPGSYDVSTSAGRSLGVSEVFRKSTVVETGFVASNTIRPVMEHTVTLKLSGDLTPGETVGVRFARDNDTAPVSARYASNLTVSEAIHISQIGFETDDPAKAAYVSLWFGRKNAVSTNGAETFDSLDGLAGRSFRVVDVNTGAAVAQGTLSVSKAAAPHVRLDKETDVYKADFSEVSKAGVYRVVVDGVGASQDIVIANDVWTDPFVTAARGFYHQRSGIALTEQHTDWERPRALHPDDGVTVLQSRASLMDTSMGLNLRSQDSFSALASNATNQVVREAWGGWHDAGDFDRRIQHLDAARDLMRLVELRPEFAKQINLNIPESRNAIPDLLDEALWGLDAFKRLQKTDGGVPGGIESNGHATFGEASWSDPQTFYVYAPDAWSSFEYAATAARAAHLLSTYAPGSAQEYLSSAVRAYAWAENNTPDYARTVGAVHAARTLASAELYRATGDQKYNEAFLKGTPFNGGQVGSIAAQIDAGMTYWLTDRSGVNERIETAFTVDLVRRADLILNDWRTAYDSFVDPNSPYSWQNVSGVPVAAANFLILAHAVTGDSKYFRGAVQDTGFGLGANPMNLSHITGVGTRSPTEIFHRDASILGEGPPPGITVFGTTDVNRMGSDITRSRIETWLGALDLADLPFHENFQPHNIRFGEFTVHGTLGPTAFVWGYLAATDPDSTSRSAGVNVVRATTAVEDRFGTPGVDRYVFDSTATSTRSATDSIRNFRPDDIIDLSALDFIRVAIGGTAGGGTLVVESVGQGSNWGFTRILAGWGQNDFQVNVYADVSVVRNAIVLRGGSQEPESIVAPMPPSSDSTGGMTGDVVNATPSKETFDGSGGAKTFVFDQIADSTRAAMDAIGNFGTDDKLDLSGVKYGKIVQDAGQMTGDALLVRSWGDLTQLNFGGWGDSAFQLQIKASQSVVLAALGAGGGTDGGTDGGAGGGSTGGKTIVADSVARTYVGAPEAETFVFASKAHSTRGATDVIQNFGAEDTIDLRGLGVTREETNPDDLNPGEILIRTWGTGDNALTRINLDGYNSSDFQLDVYGKPAYIVESLLF